MLREIQNKLAPVRRRLRWQAALSSIAGAMIIGGWAALIAALLTLFGGSFTAGMIGLVFALGLPLVVLIAVLLRPPTWNVAARIVDRHFHLHDRISTALHLSQLPHADPFDALQINDATNRINELDVGQAARLSLPWNRLLSGIVITALAVTLIAWGILAPPTAQIQTSGDMQDLRPEILPRTSPSTIEVDTGIAQRSLDEFASFQPGRAKGRSSTAMETSITATIESYFKQLDE